MRAPPEDQEKATLPYHVPTGRQGKGVLYQCTYHCGLELDEATAGCARLAAALGESGTAGKALRSCVARR